MAMANIDTLGRITPHRARILDLIRGGDRAPEIAAKLTISKKTVYSHYQQLEEITDCHSTTELGVWWERNEAAWEALQNRRRGT